MPLGGMHLPFLKLQLQHTVWDKRLNFEIPVPVPTKLRSDTEVSQMPSMVLDLAPKLHACHVTHRRHSYRHGGTQCPEIYILCLFLNIGIMGLLTIQPLPHAYRGPSRNMAIPPPSKPPACPLQQEDSAADLEQIQCSNSPPCGNCFPHQCEMPLANIATRRFRATIWANQLASLEVKGMKLQKQGVS